MGSIAQPGSQQGSRGTPVSGPFNPSQTFGQWFLNFLKQELKPYPGRTTLAARYLLAATITMFFIMIFQLPGASVGGFYSLLLSRESPFTTARGGFTILSAFVLGLAFVLIGAILFVGYPITHFLWVIGSFFVAFYGISALSNYGAATAFGIVIVLLVPIWDQTAPQAALVVASLWTAGSVAVAIASTILVEYAFSLFGTRDELKDGICDRLTAVRMLLLERTQNAVTSASENRVQQFAMIGVSRLRRLALHSGQSQEAIARLSTTVSQTGRLIDFMAVPQHHLQVNPEETQLRKAIATQIRILSQKIKDPRIRVQALPKDLPEPNNPVLISLQHVTELLRMSLSPEGLQPIAADKILPSPPSLFGPDFFTNPEHLKFALRGCLASVLCYFIFTSVFWPGLSPSLFTCVITALTSIGTSRQKQILRTSGALVGGLVFGMGSQIFILPLLDTIAGFAVLFVIITAIAAWILTSSPRLSYFGTQIALAFYLIQLRGPFAQTNLAIARDNIMGILLGLVVMWLVFDQLGSKPAVQVMRELFAENLRLMAKLARPWPGGRPADLKQIRTVRDKISQNFSNVNSQADAVLFEVGASRARSLKLRARLHNWQPKLRSLFLLEIAILQHRLQVEPDQLPPTIVQASDQFDRELSVLLENLAHAFTHDHKPYVQADVQGALAHLNAAIVDAYQGRPNPRAQAVLALSSQVVDITCVLAEDMSST